MSKANKILSEMEDVLDKLIENAQKLHNLSKHAIAEEELSPLQSIQQELLSTLVSLDDTYHNAHPNPSHVDDLTINKRIQKKLDVFEQLNSSFVDNIVNSHGLIQFETAKLKKTKKVADATDAASTRLTRNAVKKGKA